MRVDVRVMAGRKDVLIVSVLLMAGRKKCSDCKHVVNGGEKRNVLIVSVLLMAERKEII